MEVCTSKLYSFSAAYFLANLFNILRTSGAIYGVSGIFTPPGILIFQKQVTLVTKFGDILLHFTCKIVPITQFADWEHDCNNLDTPRNWSRCSKCSRPKVGRIIWMWPLYMEPTFTFGSNIMGMNMQKENLIAFHVYF